MAWQPAVLVVFSFTLTICNKDELWEHMNMKERDNINGLT